MKLKPRSTAFKVLLAVVLVLAAGIGTALVQENKVNSQAKETEFTWTPPTTGTPVHHYVVEVKENEKDTEIHDPVPSESIMLALTFGNKYRVRVAAVDANGVKGPMSIWSEPFTPELAPPGFF